MKEGDKVFVEGVVDMIVDRDGSVQNVTIDCADGSRFTVAHTAVTAIETAESEPQTEQVHEAEEPIEVAKEATEGTEAAPPEQEAHVVPAVDPKEAAVLKAMAENANLTEEEALAKTAKRKKGT